MGDNDKALDYFKQVTKLEPDLATGYNSTGAVYLRQGNWNDAIPMFTKTIELQPSPLSYSNLGTTNFFLGQYNIAAQMFEKAAGLSPNDPSIRANLGDAYRAAGQRDKAMAAYEEAIRLAANLLKVNPQDTEALGDMAIAYAKKGDPKQGLNFIEQARSLNRNANLLMYKEATIYALAGDHASALKSLGEALQNGYSLKEAMSDPELKTLRGTPEFDRLRKDLSSKAK
jgi:tetratricopeptide (TPR) repeat protein